MASVSYQRGISFWGLMLSSVSAMIGSGWLFSAFYVSRFAGPASIFAWLIGGLGILIIAMTYAEVTTLVPVAGASTRLPQITHGTFVSLFFGWITWFTLMTAPPIITQAMLEYAGGIFPALLKSGHALSHLGTFVAIMLILLFSVINTFSIRFISRINTVLSVVKIAVPLMTALLLFMYSFHAHNFVDPQEGGFAPFGFKGMLTGIATGGIFFAFNGVKQAVELAGEAENPRRSVLFGVVGSVLIALFVYVVLQIAFVGSLPHNLLAHGWNHLKYVGDSGPLAGLLITAGLGFFIYVLYTDVLVATGAAALVYTTSAARTLYGLSGNRQLPAFLHELSGRGIPVNAVLVNFVMGVIFFMFFKGWLAMEKFMSAIIALSFITGPICCVCMRYQMPDVKRVLRLPWVWAWSFVGLYCCTVVVYWTGWLIVSRISLALIISLAAFVVYRIFSDRPKAVKMHWKASFWMWPYLIGLTLISYFGSTQLGGTGAINHNVDFLALAALSVITLYSAVHFRAGDGHVEKTMVRLTEEAETGIPSTVPLEEKADDVMVR
jgi:amino acid transporter